MKNSQIKEDDGEENLNVKLQTRPCKNDLNHIQEENFGFCERNQYSFHTFNTSHLKDDNSFIDSSFNTVLNLNTEISDLKGSSDQLKTDLSENKLPSGYYKFRIFVPEKGELICKQHVIDLSSVKVISSTQNSLGKVFMPKKSYIHYLLETKQKDIESEDTKNDSIPEIKANNPKPGIVNTSNHSSFERSKTWDSNTFDLEFKDGSSYSGQIIINGYGTYKDSRGNVYEGNWNYNKHAKAAINSPDRITKLNNSLATVINCCLQMNDSKHGQGKQTFVADSFYKPSNNDSISSIEDDFYKKGGKNHYLKICNIL